MLSCVFSCRKTIDCVNVAIVKVGGSNETVRCFGLLLRCSFPLHRYWSMTSLLCPMRSRPSLCCVLKSITAMRCRLSSSPLFLITRLRVAAKQCQSIVFSFSFGYSYIKWPSRLCTNTPHAHHYQTTLRMKTPRSRGLMWIWGARAVVRHESFCGLGLLYIHETGKPLPQKAFVEDTSVVPVCWDCHTDDTELWTHKVCTSVTHVSNTHTHPQL